jgi:ankyrin repeat protein
MLKSYQRFHEEFSYSKWEHDKWLLDYIPKLGRTTGEEYQITKQKVLAIIDNINDVNIGHVFGDTALNLAIFHGEIEVVKALLEVGADPNKKTNHMSPSLFAVQPQDTKNIELFQLLLEAGADPNVTNENEETILHHVCENNEFSGEIVKLLLEAGADPNLVNFNLLPIHNVVTDISEVEEENENQRNKLEYLLQKGAKVPSDIFNYLELEELSAGQTELAAEFQRNFLSNHPQQVAELIKHVDIHPQIKKEFAFLLGSLRSGII